MPELPEVESVRRNLETQIVGRTVVRVEVRLPRIVRTPPNPEVFAAMLSGVTVTGVGRRGKYLLIYTDALTLVSHLRMEGQYRLTKAGEEESSHTHVVFYFNDKTELRYRDVRQFGTMDLVYGGMPWPRGLLELGPEPFDSLLEKGGLWHRIHSRRAPLKSVLLDQTTLAGLGNIYVDESLFAAGIHPERPANQVTKVQAQALLSAIREVLTRAIAAGGSSVRTYVDGYGRHGGFQIQLQVYAREGQSCRVCGVPIEKIRVAGRGTHFCPQCQPRRRQTRPAIALQTGVAVKRAIDFW
ncbi:bifunctional DNA-formamidopyrimidine glycosylase/DNA-(apurinic or apyrimidinic site) lyase [Alicyclobacillaceae bacterium I2511]|nr:bifunctional DNA-formamidopyrimidine glycosylase/DNA-(apurinic or apyrimidinic site) lyase [Alicyclobacillaceae bacterium I2511]